MLHFYILKQRLSTKQLPLGKPFGEELQTRLSGGLQVEMIAWINTLKKMYATAWCVFVLVGVWYFKTQDVLDNDTPNKQKKKHCVK